MYVLDYLIYHLKPYGVVRESHRLPAKLKVGEFPPPPKEETLNSNEDSKDDEDKIFSTTTVATVAVATLEPDSRELDSKEVDSDKEQLIQSENKKKLKKLLKQLNREAKLAEDYDYDTNRDYS